MKDFKIRTLFGQYRGPLDRNVCAASKELAFAAVEAEIGDEKEYVKSHHVVTVHACQHEKGRVV